MAAADPIGFSASARVPFPRISTRSSNLPGAGIPATENGRMSVRSSDTATFTNCPGRGVGKSGPASIVNRQHVGLTLAFLASVTFVEIDLLKDDFSS